MRSDDAANALCAREDAGPLPRHGQRVLPRRRCAVSLLLRNRRVDALKADKRVIEAESVQCVCKPFEAFYFVYICLFFYFYHYGPWVLSLFRNWKQSFGRGVVYFCISLIFGYLNTTFFADVGTLEFGTLRWMSMRSRSGPEIFDMYFSI